MVAGPVNAVHPHSRGIGVTSQRARDRLVTTLQRMGIHDENVLAAINRVPRHEFIDEAMSYEAYDNNALPIGHGQTISQPYVVARMTEVLLDEFQPQSVLEIGTGCGYQTAVLAELIPTVYTVERIKALHEGARKRLRRMGYHRVRFKFADGSWGWEERRPYDAIIVTAAAETVPKSLLEQLAKGGRMVIPVGASNGQELLLIKRTAAGYEQSILEGVAFVPLLSETRG